MIPLASTFPNRVIGLRRGRQGSAQLQDCRPGRLRRAGETIRLVARQPEVYHFVPFCATVTHMSPDLAIRIRCRRGLCPATLASHPGMAAGLQCGGFRSELRPVAVPPHPAFGRPLPRGRGGQDGKPSA